MTERDKLQLSYELAFFPPRLNELWSRIRIGIRTNREEVGQLLIPPFSSIKRCRTGDMAPSGRWLVSHSTRRMQGRSAW
jgi:hypothetical protein